VFEPELSRKEIYCIKESTCDIFWGRFGAPAVIRRPRGDSAPGELSPPCPPSLRPWSEVIVIFLQLILFASTAAFFCFLLGLVSCTV